MSGILLAALAGVALIAEGLLIRGGRLREGVINVHGNESAPRYRRNAIFALIPAGVTLLLGAGAAAADGDGKNHSPLGITLIVAAIGMFFVAVAFAIHPPRFVKPRWLLENDGAPLPPIEVGPVRYYGPWVVLAIATAVVFIVHAPIQWKASIPFAATGLLGMNRRLRR